MRRAGARSPAVALLAAILAASARCSGGCEFGLYTLVLNSDLIQCTFNKSLGLDVSLLKLHTYDFARSVNTTYNLNTSAAAILANSDFDRSRHTLLFVHGFTTTVDDVAQEELRADLKRWQHSYVYMVDHRSYTYLDGYDYIGSYERSVQYYYDIGSAIANFLADLVAGGVDLDRVRVFGHSLGGQIIAAVGEAFSNRTGKLLPWLLASDPAGPCFSSADKQFQLRTGLARRVHVIHCDKGQLGTANDYADASFNANGGEEQPGCQEPSGILSDAMASMCSHAACPRMLTRPVVHPQLWPALRCGSTKDFYDGACAANGAALAGLPGDTGANGTYYFSTIGFMAPQHFEWSSSMENTTLELNACTSIVGSGTK